MRAEYINRAGGRSSVYRTITLCVYFSKIFKAFKHFLAKQPIPCPRPMLRWWALLLHIKSSWPPFGTTGEDMLRWAPISNRAPAREQCSISWPKARKCTYRCKRSPKTDWLRPLQDEFHFWNTNDAFILRLPGVHGPRDAEAAGSWTRPRFLSVGRPLVRDADWSASVLQW